MIVRVERAGLLTTVQDGGRWGQQAEGVSVSGPMDLYSHRLANLLAGNGEAAATLEVTLAGPVLAFDDDRRVAVAGAEFEVTVEGRTVSPNSAVEVAAGERLAFGRRLKGARAYVAIAGGIDTPAVLGSRATHLPSGLGGLHGRALRNGDELPLGQPSVVSGFGRTTRDVGAGFSRTAVRPPEGGPHVLRVLPGPQLDRFADDALDTLQSAPYRIATDSNRQGYRLEGPRLRHASGADIVSDATPFGALQVPASGQPILLMADRQTTGGYAKIAIVITADLGLAAQLAPGDEVAFTTCTLEDARAALASRERQLVAGGQ